jgi:hypothetical protein
MLEPDERAILFGACRDHTVASCPRCSQTYTYRQLAAALSPYRPHRCQRCQGDLTEAIRGHMRTCLGALLAWTHQVRERARITQKESRQRRDESELFRAEREAAELTPGRIVTCAYCNEPLGADRVALLAPPFADFVHGACFPPARAQMERLRRDGRHLRTVSGDHGQTPLT